MSEQQHAWTGQTVAGRYLLGKYLGGTGHGKVFSTEIVHARAVQVAIKLISEAKVEGTANRQLSRWREFVGISHTNLLKILDCGKCELDGEAHLFVVQEYADEDLGDILPERALTMEEARGMIEPVIEMLALLHGRILSIRGFIRGIFWRWEIKSNSQATRLRRRAKHPVLPHQWKGFPRRSGALSLRIPPRIFGRLAQQLSRCCHKRSRYSESTTVD